MVTEEKNIDILQKLFAPFKVIKFLKSYILWVIFIMFFGLINIWASLFTNQPLVELKSAFLQGQFYTFSIALCSPFIMTFLLDFVLYRTYREEPHFVTYKINSCIINFIWIFVMTFMWSQSLRSSFWVQLFSTLFSIVFSFYMFCIGEMEKHNMYDFDDGYIEKENKRMKETTKKARKTKKINTERGEVKL